MNTQQKDRKYVGRDVIADDVEIAKSDGSFLYDPKGRNYIDFLMGWCVGNIGWGQSEIKKRLAGFKGPEYVCPNFLYEPWA